MNSNTNSDDKKDRITEKVLKPAITPIIAVIAVVTGILLLGIGLVIMGQTGDDPLFQIGGGFIILICFIVLLNSLARIIVLRRTKYVLDDGMLRKSFHLFYRRSEREVPVHQIRGVELNQSTIQAVLGFGTIVFLTAGPNQSLGFLTFKNISHPVDYRDEIQSYVRNSSEAR